MPSGNDGAGGESDEAGRDRIVGVNHREAVGRKCSKILGLAARYWRRAVEVEMVAADIGHASHVQLDAGDAAQAQRMAGDSITAWNSRPLPFGPPNESGPSR